MNNEGFIDDQGNVLNGKAKTLSNGTKSDKDVTDSHLESGMKLQPTDEMSTHEDDPWKVTSIKQDYTPWSELNEKQKVIRFVTSCIKIILVFGCLYMFICSLDFLSSAFRLLGGEAAGKVFQQSDILTNPVTGLMIGVLVTVLVQSSSTSTSIVVSMVGSGIMTIRTAIPIIMGANVGTSVTNTIVAIGQITDKAEFRRAFAGATVHDMFNWLTVLVLLPMEMIFGYLYYLTEAIVDSLPLISDQGADKDILKVITEPFTERIIQINKNAITNLASGKLPDSEYDRTILKVCCDKKTPQKCCDGKKIASKVFRTSGANYTHVQKTKFCHELSQCKGLGMTNSTQCENTPWVHKSFKEQHFDCHWFNNPGEVNCCLNYLSSHHSNVSQRVGCEGLSTCFNANTSAGPFNMSSCLSSWDNRTVLAEDFSCSIYTRDVANVTCLQECEFLFKGMYPTLEDKAIGGILLVISLGILCVCLVCIVKLLHSLLQGPMAMLVKRFINADFPGPLAYFTGYLAIIIGAGLTIVVQSSSIFTSTLTPLVGMGVIELDRMYPLTLGSNIGTTTTAILSALANTSGLRNALQVAFCHLFFNVTGILLFYPIPFMRFPIPLAKFLGNRTAEYRWFAIVYILTMFFLFPALVFALSIPGWYVLLGVLGPFVVILIAVGVVKVIQAKRPGWLPEKYRNWKFLPTPLRSLRPYDRAMQKVFFCKKFQQKDSKEDGEAPNGNTAPTSSQTLSACTKL